MVFAGGFWNAHYDLEAYDADNKPILILQKRCPIQEKADGFQQALFHHFYLLKRSDIAKINRELRVDSYGSADTWAQSGCVHNLSAQEKSFHEKAPALVVDIAKAEAVGKKENEQKQKASELSGNVADDDANTEEIEVSAFWPSPTEFSQG